MVKKLVFGILLLTVVTTALFAEIVQFSYAGNGTEQQFALLATEATPSGGMFPTRKLPNGIVREIDNALQDYSLNVGDVFTTILGYNGRWYVVYLRITDAKSCRWQFHAWIK
jgi:hypothetical protein